MSGGKIFNMKIQNLVLNKHPKHCNEKPFIEHLFKLKTPRRKGSAGAFLPNYSFTIDSGGLEHPEF